LGLPLFGFFLKKLVIDEKPFSLAFSAVQGLGGGAMVARCRQWGNPQLVLKLSTSHTLFST
jgi:hypothetical protein